MTDYSKIEYPLDESQPGQYPDILCKYLVDRFKLKGYLLDVGGGQGFYQIGFSRYGLSVAIIDKYWNDNLEIKWDVWDDLCDIVFSKSVIEHIHNQENFVSEIKRILKPGGLVICLTPNYLDQWKNFYDDPTHVRPFTQKGLEMAFKLAGFKNIHSEIFTQLPFFWRHRWLVFVLPLIRLLPDRFKYHKGKQNVLIRHAKERMILLWATK